MRTLALVTMCLLGACGPATTTPPPPPASQPAAIGVATMRPDGTLVLDLRATGPGGALGDARLVYPPGHAQYQTILQHLGGMTPGQQKPVPPFP
jgi:hypothetical protein